MDDIFNFKIISIEQQLDIWHSELLSQNNWDNLFYRGELLTHEIEQIRCITPCPSCYKSWFNLKLADFENNSLAQLVLQGFLSNETIKEQKLARILEFGASSDYFYKTMLGCPASYVQVKCLSCKTKHLIILGITETQPALYTAQLQGIWRLK